MYETFVIMSYSTRNGCGQSPQCKKAPAYKPGLMFNYFWTFSKALYKAPSQSTRKILNLNPLFKKTLDLLSVG